MSLNDLEKQSSDQLDTNTAHNLNEDEHSVAKCYTSGSNHEYIVIGNTKVLRTDLVEAFGGTLQPGYAPPSKHKFANPAPLGLSAFALTTFVLSLINARARDVSTPNVVVGLAFFYGGFIQLLAGMWEIAVENTFGGTALSSYGGFWMSWGAIQHPWFGIKAAYTDKKELSDAVSFFLLGWTLFTFMMMLCTLKSTVAFFSLFFFLEITFLLLTIGDFTGKIGVTKAAGVMGILTALIAWYNAFAGIANKQNSYITAKAFPLPGSKI